MTKCVIFNPYPHPRVKHIKGAIQFLIGLSEYINSLIVRCPKLWSVHVVVPDLRKAEKILIQPSIIAASICHICPLFHNKIQ